MITGTIKVSIWVYSPWGTRFVASLLLSIFSTKTAQSSPPSGFTTTRQVLLHRCKPSKPPGPTKLIFGSGLNELAEAKKPT